MNSIIQAMQNVRLVPDHLVIIDGSIHRFYVQGEKSGTKNGWYIFYNDPIVCGAFGNWRTGEKYQCSEKAASEMSFLEKQIYQEKIAQAYKERELKRFRKQYNAKTKASLLWKKAQAAPFDHTYFRNKAIKSHGLKELNKSLLVPVYDDRGVLWSIQFIRSDGSKRFLSGGKIQGCYYPIGQLERTLCVAEGYATAASIYEATGHAVIVAFNAGNLRPVAEVMQSKYPKTKIIICADNDEHTKGNPGVTKAKEAARAVSGHLTIAGEYK